MIWDRNEDEAVMYAGIIVFLRCGAAMAYVRLAPTDLARWHAPIEATADETRTLDGAVRVIAADAQSWRKSRMAARQRARRARRLSPDQWPKGRITYRHALQILRLSRLHDGRTGRGR